MSNSRTEVRSPTRTEVRSPTRTSTRANTRGNFTSTVTGGAGAGETSVTINIPQQTPHDTGSLMHYPIAMGSDTGGLDAPLVALSKQPPVLRVGIGAGVGLAIGSLVKRPLIGTLLGAIGGYIAADYIPKS